MWKKVKVVMLPTGEKVNPVGSIIEVLKPKNNENIGLCINHNYLNTKSDSYYKLMDLYFLSDEEIKEGDWVLAYNEIKRADTKMLKYLFSSADKELKKIIATTDETLITCQCGKSSHKMSCKQSYKLPQIPQSFIEYYVSEYNKGNIITEVMVEYETLGKYGKVWLAKSTFNNESNSDMSIYFNHLIINPDNTINIKPIKESWNREEVKQLLLNLSSFKGDQDDHKDVNQWIEENL